WEMWPVVDFRQVSPKTMDAGDNCLLRFERLATVGGTHVFDGLTDAGPLAVTMPDDVHRSVEADGNLRCKGGVRELATGRLVADTLPVRTMVDRTREAQRGGSTPRNVDMPVEWTGRVVIADDPGLVIGQVPDMQRRRRAPR